MTDTKERDHAEENARGWMQSIREMTAELQAALDDQDDRRMENATEAISESALSVEVRRSFEVLLTTGGPGLRIVGTLDEYNEPENARLEKQDWFTPWTPVELVASDQDALDKFAATFYFGEGE